jgi:hypothetical protein
MPPRTGHEHPGTGEAEDDLDADGEEPDRPRANFGQHSIAGRGKDFRSPKTTQLPLKVCLEPAARRFQWPLTFHAHSEF